MLAVLASCPKLETLCICRGLCCCESLGHKPWTSDNVVLPRLQFVQINDWNESMHDFYVALTHPADTRLEFCVTGPESQWNPGLFARWGISTSSSTQRSATTMVLRDNTDEVFQIVLELRDQS